MTTREQAGRSAADYAPPAALEAIRRGALLTGGVGAAAAILGFVLDPAQFYRSYLIAFVFWLSIALGCFALSTLHHLSSGAWGLMIRRILEAATRTLPFLALFFVPVIPGMRVLYHWARPEDVAADPHLQHQALYLNVPFFIGRTALYFAIWIGFALVLDRMSRRQDRQAGGEVRGAPRDPRLTRRMQMVAAPGLILYCLTATFASIDWLMSINPHFHSSMYGVAFVGGQAVSALAFTILVTLWLSRRPPMDVAFRPTHFHDYGKLLFTFVVLWAYFAASQLIISYQGNLPMEVGYYRTRTHGGWGTLSLLIIAGHFALPFFLLLGRDLKRHVGGLSVVAALLLVMRWCDLYWQAAPIFSPDGPALHWLDAATMIAIGGLWIGLFAGQLARRPLLPVGDPALPEALNA